MRLPAITCCLIVCSAHLLGAPADFNAVSGYGTILEKLSPTINEVTIEAITLASETTEPDGRKRLSFTASLHNTGEGYFEGAQIRFDKPTTPPSPEWPIEIVNDAVVMPDLEPSGTVTLPQPIVLLAPAADANAVKNAVLAGQHLYARATELYQFRLPPSPIDDATNDAFDHATSNLLNDDISLYFEQMTPFLQALQPGTLLMETIMTDSVTRTYDGFNNLTGLAKHVSTMKRWGPPDFGRLRTERMVEVESVTLEQDGKVKVHGKQWGGQELDLSDVLHLIPSLQTNRRVRGFFDNLRTGTLLMEAIDLVDAGNSEGRDPFDPPVGNTFYTSSETEERAITAAELRDRALLRHPALSDLKGFFSLHMPINEMEIIKGVTVDGEVSLQGAKVGLMVRMKNLAPKFIMVRMGNELEVNLRATIRPGADNTGSLSFEKEKVLTDIALATFYFNVGGVPVEIQPRFKALVGISANVSTQVVLPFTGSFEIGTDYYWDLTAPPGQQFHQEDFKDFRPLALSKPQLADSLSLNVDAWAEAQFSLIINKTIGPYIGPKANFNFQLRPLDNPWWSTSGNVSCKAGFQIRMLGYEITDPAIHEFDGPELFNTGAGGPVQRGSGAGQPPPGPYEPVEGENVRWAKTLQWNNSGPTPYTADIAPVTGAPEEVFLVAPNAFEVSPPVVKLDTKGNVVWAKGAAFMSPRKLAPTPDGGVISYSAAGGDTLALVRHAPNGDVLWVQGVVPVNDDVAQSHRIYSVGGVVVKPTTPGHFEILVGGSLNNNAAAFDDDPFFLKFDDTGALLSSTRYASTNMLETVRDAILLNDGKLLLAGEARGNSDGTPINSGAEWGGWLMKINPDTNQVLWSIRSKPAISWNKVTESPDGIIFTAGNFLPIVTADIPAMTVGAYNANGSIERLISLAEPPITPSSFLDSDDKGVMNYALAKEWLEDSGFTPYDQLLSLAWTPSGLLVTGYTGNGNDTAPMSILLTEKLGVRWMVTHEGDGLPDSTLDVLPTNEGIYTVGVSNSFGSVAGLGILQIAKQPYEGSVPYHKSTHAIVKYLQPTVYNLLVGSWGIHMPHPQVGYEETESFNDRYTPMPLATVAAPPLPQPWNYNDVTGVIQRRLDHGNPNAPMTFTQWVDYMQLPAGTAPEDDFDHDEVSNQMEYLFGGNPYQPDPPLPQLLNISERPDGGIRLHTFRGISSLGTVTPVFTTTALSTSPWLPLGEVPADWQQEPSLFTDPDNTQRLFLDLAPDPATRRFYRMLLD
ncbi:MAG: hypothetical protein JNJ83_04560 [Verrucomicrobiaceae bacterium]|nr:hypothetical protein [Verrucomicrobiaceae bacterium]